MKLQSNSYLMSLLVFCSVALSQGETYLTELQTLDEYRVLNGEIEAVNKATVSAQTAGRVSKLNYDVDDYVSKNSILVEFTNDEQKSGLKQAEENAKAAKIAFEQAETDYVRVKDIYEKKLVAKSQLDQALSNRNALEAKASAAEAAVLAAKKQFEYTVIRAPYDGIVTNRFVEQGETVSPGTPIMEGLSLDNLRVITYVPESIITKVRNNPHAIIQLNDGTEIVADKITIFPYANQATRTFKVRLDLAQTENTLFPGMSVKIKFKIDEKPAITIPESAIVTRSELIMAYVLSDNGEILPRQVKTGIKHDGKIEVISGISENEKVLINPLVK